ncbi:MAG: ABC transporter substrate-binding protein, partial [Clostridia bacterium]|nr:ABC transporter substrate-binding protein [Clostridia bacterium]
MKKIISVILSVMLIASAFAGCNKAVDVDKEGAADLQNYPVTVNEVTISSKPSAAVVLDASLADAVLATGYETSLKAVVDTATQDEYKTLTKIAPDDIDAIIDMKADVVLTDSLDEANITKLSEAGIKTVIISPADSRSDFERMYTQLGSVLGGAKDGYNKGLTSAQNIFTSLDDLSRIIPNNKTISTACYLFDTESKAVTGEYLLSTVMEYAGLTNVFKGSENGSYDFENLRVTNPDFIFCPVGLKKSIMSDENFAGLKAVQNDNVHEISTEAATWQGRTIILTATEIASVAYPSLTQESSATVSYEGVETSEAPEESKSKETEEEELTLGPDDEESKEENAEESSEDEKKAEESSEAESETEES